MLSLLDEITLASMVRAQQRKLGLLAAAIDARKVRDLEAERQTIADAMNISSADTIRTARRSQDLAKLRDAVKDIDRAWEAATIEERKAMLRLAIDRVRVIGTGRGKTIAIDWASGV
jgi:hypothetical protein